MPSPRAIAAIALLTSCAEPVWEGGFEEPVARPEHPRPDWRRDTFINLDTTWDFAYDPDDVGLAEQWYLDPEPFTERIQVPFPWEAPLSGQAEPHEGPYSLTETTDRLTYMGVAWYRLDLPGPLPAGHDWWLVVGAADYEATVWVDGMEVGHHVGGYAPFSVNLSQAAGTREGAAIAIRVVDWTEDHPAGPVQPVGKQGGWWFTRSSGIWQTAYLEQRPRLHLTGLSVRADVEAGELWVTPEYSGVAAVEVEARLDGGVVGRASAPLGTPGPLRLVLAEVAPWSAQTPDLYELEVRLITDTGTDRVHTTAGLVEVGVDWLPGRSPLDTQDPAEQAGVFTVNGEPVFLRCVLDQAYWPDGIYTAPSLDDLREDLERARDLGFNCVRTHVKVDEPARLHLMDELGLYGVQDLPSLDIYAPNTPDFPGRTHFEHTLEEVVHRDRNHPSLLLWTVFNENWGLIPNGKFYDPTLLAEDPELREWVEDMVGATREVDPTRPVEDNSAGGLVRDFEHVTGDSNSFHWYHDDAEAWRALVEAQDALTFPGSTANWVGDEAQAGQPWWNSEFAAFTYASQPEGDAAFCALYGALNEMRRLPRLVGWTLTQLTDVEFEHNGLYQYDREHKDNLCTRSGVSLEDVLGPDFVGFEWLPGVAIDHNRQVDLPLFFSQWSGDEPRPLIARARWGEAGWAGEAAFSSAGWDVVRFEIGDLDVPDDEGLQDIVVEVVDDAGVRVCANRIQVDIE